jgi:hypothetical protein
MILSSTVLYPVGNKVNEDYSDFMDALNKLQKLQNLALQIQKGSCMYRSVHLG